MSETASERATYSWSPWMVQGGTRVKTSQAHWAQLVVWNRAVDCDRNCNEYDNAECPGTKGPCIMQRPPIIFASLCDPFENWQGPIRDSRGACLYLDDDTGDVAAEIPVGSGGRYRPLTMADLRDDWFDLIDRSPNLTHCLRTKRPQNVLKMWPCRECGRTVDSPCLYHTITARRENCWLLYSASDQASLDAGMPYLKACRDLVPVLGLSLEPLVGPVLLDLVGIDWVRVGGESGPGGRPCHIKWIESILDQCAAAGVPCFIKQLGANVGH